MGVVRRSTEVAEDTKGKKGAEADEKEERGVVVDFQSEKLEAGEVRKLNKEAALDAWGSSAPPPASWYKLRILPLKKEDQKMFLNDENDEKKGFFYGVTFDMQIVGGDYDGTVIPYNRASTKIYPRKEMSTMAAIIVLAGYDCGDEASDATIAKKFAKLSHKQAVFPKELYIDWRAQYKDSKGKYRTVYRSYDDFPDAPDGGKEYECTITGDKGEPITVYGRAYVRWNEEPSKESKGGEKDELEEDIKPAGRTLKKSEVEKEEKEEKKEKEKPKTKELTSDDLDEL